MLALKNWYQKDRNNIFNFVHDIVQELYLRDWRQQWEYSSWNLNKNIIGYKLGKTQE